MFQGFGYVKGMDMTQFILKSELTQGKNVKYPWYVVDWRPENIEPWRTRITYIVNQFYHYEETKPYTEIM